MALAMNGYTLPISKLRKPERDCVIFRWGPGRSTITRRNS